MLENVIPKLYNSTGIRKPTKTELNDDEEDFIDSYEIFDIIRDINDPEHPLTLEELNVVDVGNINVFNSSVEVKFTPTIPNCSMATIIGLSIKVKLLRSLPSKYKIAVKVTEGTHMAEEALNKQLRDKERVAAALENSYLLQTVNKCLFSKYFQEINKS